jgi:hypothetical protein
VFDSVKAYTATVTLTLTDPAKYAFSDSTSFSIDGTAGTFTPDATLPTKGTVEVPFGLAIRKNLVAGVALDITAPVAGKAPQATVSGGDTYSVNATASGKIKWATIGSTTTLDPSKAGVVFAPNAGYTVTLTITPAAGYTFTVPEDSDEGEEDYLVRIVNVSTIDTTADEPIGGIEAALNTAKDEVSVVVTFNDAGKLIVDSLTLSGLVAPKIGETPVGKEAVTNVPTGKDKTARWTVSDLTWLDGDGETVTGAFGAETAYEAVLTLAAETAYTFAGIADTTVSGAPAGVTSCWAARCRAG